MYGIETIIDFLETREVPASWKAQLDWDEFSFASVSIGILYSFWTSTWFANNKPFKTPHKQKIERAHALIKCIPELESKMQFNTYSYTFKDPVDLKKVHSWIRENYESNWGFSVSRTINKEEKSGPKNF